MFTNDRSKNSIEILEARIAPASAIATSKFIAAVTGSPIILHAGETLTTGGKVTIPGVGDVGAGTYLLYVEKGTAMVFTTDFNNNKQVDFNEITGIAAGDGLRMVSFVDINGDIVTNLNADTTLSDSNNNSSDDDPFLKGDGRVVLNNTIEKIELRSLNPGDVLDENGDGDTTQEVIARLALTSYSIHGNIYAGKGFGVTAAGGTSADPASGLIIDDSGRALQGTAFDTTAGADFYDEATRGVKPSVGFIRTGTATSGEWFTFGFGAALNNPKAPAAGTFHGTFQGRLNIQGYLTDFAVVKGQIGGDIAGVHTVNPSTNFNVSGFIAGNGGSGARGGNIVGVVLNGDNAGGYIVKAGNGGRGATGGDGGSIIDFQDISGQNDPAAATGQIVIQSGSGGGAYTGTGGNGGIVTLGPMLVNGGLAINLGNGGDGFIAGGNGASLATASILTPEGKVQFGSNNIATTHQGSIDPKTGKLAADNYGVIGRHFGVDFDHDGFGDAVFTSSNPNELTVVFGNGDGTFRNELTPDPTLPTADPSNLPVRSIRIALDAPVNPEGLVVADFNQDGFMDIAVASSDPGNFGGISVFLAKTEDTNDDGILSPTEDLPDSHGHTNGVVNFVGFRTARQSFLPSLNSGDPDVPNLSLTDYIYKRSAVPITALQAGDFNGDGYTDLAVLATYLVPDPTKTPPVSPIQVVMFLVQDVEVNNFHRPDMVDTFGTVVESGRPTGQFYADVGSKAAGAPVPKGANPYVPFFPIGGGVHGIIESTAMTTQGDGLVLGTTRTDVPLFANVHRHDVVAAAVLGGDRVRILDDSIPSLAGPVLSGIHIIPQGNPGPDAVDLDRQLGPTHVNLADPTVRDFAIVDFAGEQFVDRAIPNVRPLDGVYEPDELFYDTNGNGVYDGRQDGVADLVILDNAHPNFLISFISVPFNLNPVLAGNASGIQVPVGAADLFTTNVNNLARDNGGYYFGGTQIVMAIRDANTDGAAPSVFSPDTHDTFNDNVAVLTYHQVPGPHSDISELDLRDSPPANIVANPGAVLLNQYIRASNGNDITVNGSGLPVVAFDTFYPIVPSVLDPYAPPINVNYITASATIDPLALHDEWSVGDLPSGGLADFTDISQHFIKIRAADGGKSLAGRGGAGGFLGGQLGAGTTAPVGSLNILLPANIAYSGEVQLNAGHGGNGFSDGGAGGSITGTSVRYVPTAGTRHTQAALYAGDGGFGVGGVGGAGGNLADNSIESGIFFAAGNGGRGRIGGNGGQIVGNGQAGVYDTRELYQSLFAGKGGNGVLAGGAGGDIRDFHGDFGLTVVDTVAGALIYVPGGGGNAISGPGGKGGSITNSSPMSDTSLLGGDIFMQGGKGGSGLSGGDGGGISQFFYKPSVADNAAVLSVVAGNGGKGVSGNGGHGGDLTTINIPSKGTPNQLDSPFTHPPTPLDDPFLVLPTRPTPFTYNRFLAGNGGDSSGATGGSGGSVAQIETLNSDGPFFIGAGKGGKGLGLGGAGGSITATNLSVGGASLAKALLVAGAGGDATAFIANPNDSSVKFQAEKAFGGLIGVGGQGGSIDGFVQNGAIEARVDLIGGDGGSTLNYGTAADSGVPVGIGGSVKNISIAGNIGNIDRHIQIKSYNKILGLNNESVADFVDKAVRNPLIAGSFSDTDGLVGIVAGAAGRLKSQQFGYLFGEDPATPGLDQYVPNLKSVPAFRGIAGDALNISARNIMSMVAGSVDRIASIQTIGNITVVANGALGIAKDNATQNPVTTISVDPNVPENYYDRNGKPITEPVLDGLLVDGAIIYKTSIGAPPNSPFVFKLGT